MDLLKIIFPLNYTTNRNITPYFLIYFFLATYIFERDFSEALLRFQFFYSVGRNLT